MPWSISDQWRFVLHSDKTYHQLRYRYWCSRPTRHILVFILWSGIGDVCLSHGRVAAGSPKRTKTPFLRAEYSRAKAVKEDLAENQISTGKLEGDDGVRLSSSKTNDSQLHRIIERQAGRGGEPKCVETRLEARRNAMLPAKQRAVTWSRWSTFALPRRLSQTTSAPSVEAQHSR